MYNVLVDTNIIRRLLEFEFNELNDQTTLFKIKYITKILITNNIYLNDQSLFELIDFISKDKKNSNKKSSTLLKIFREYKVDIVCRDSTRELFDKWDQFLDDKMSMDDAKFISFNSFLFSLIEFIFQVSQFLSLSILKKLAEGNYTSDFYIESSTYIISDEYKKSFVDIYKKLIFESYFQDGERTKNIIEQLLKQTLVWCVSFYKLYQSNDKKNQENFYMYFKSIMDSCKNDDYFELLNFKGQIDWAADIIEGPTIDSLSYCYLQNVCYNLIAHKKKIKLNDIVDFLNFKIAYEEDFIYLTLDDDSLKLYEKIYSDNEEIKKYITKCKCYISRTL